MKNNMRYIADLHIHSKYSRACSKELVPEKIDLWCRIKGVDIISSGDFTHPKWFAELQEKLEPAEKGLFRLKAKYSEAHPLFVEKEKRDVRFVIGTELSCIYKKNNKSRRVHLLVFAPSFEIAKKINHELEKKGFNLKSDGRPILGIDSEDLLKLLIEIDERIVLVPAHIWTPWFAIFGSKSGFDSMEECFNEMAKYIFAVETGLSSDVVMNRQLANLNNIALISNSDAHSLQVIGREANIFEGNDLSYDLLFQAIRNSTENRYKKSSNLEFIKTIEFFPEEGRYYLDGHADCKISMLPLESVKYKNICPKCGLPLTLGVLHQIEELSKKDKQNKKIDVNKYTYSIELEKIIAEAMNVRGRNSKIVQKYYWPLINNVGGELPVLLDTALDDIKLFSDKIAEAIRRVRDKKINIKGGYDGAYGEVSIFKK